MNIQKFSAAVLVKKKSDLKIKKLDFYNRLEKGQVLVKFFILAYAESKLMRLTELEL